MADRDVDGDSRPQQSCYRSATLWHYTKYNDAFRRLLRSESVTHIHTHTHPTTPHQQLHNCATTFTKRRALLPRFSFYESPSATFLLTGFLYTNFLERFSFWHHPWATLLLPSLYLFSFFFLSISFFKPFLPLFYLIFTFIFCLTLFRILGEFLSSFYSAFPKISKPPTPPNAFSFSHFCRPLF